MKGSAKTGPGTCCKRIHVCQFYCLFSNTGDPQAELWPHIPSNAGTGIWNALGLMFFALCCTWNWQPISALHKETTLNFIFSWLVHNAWPDSPKFGLAGQNVKCSSFTACSENLVRRCFFFFLAIARRELGADEAPVKLLSLTLAPTDAFSPTTSTRLSVLFVWVFYNRFRVCVVTTWRFC